MRDVYSARGIGHRHMATRGCSLPFDCEHHLAKPDIGLAKSTTRSRNSLPLVLLKSGSKSAIALPEDF